MSIITEILAMLSQQMLKLHESCLRSHSAIGEDLLIDLMSDFGFFYNGTKNLRIARLMIRISKDQSLSRDARIIAYVMFLEVIGRLIEEWPDPGSLHLPDDLNWSLINRYDTVVGNIGIYCHRFWHMVTLRESAW
jgi:hypothetical protein